MSVKPRGILITGEFNLLLNDNLKISSFKRDNVINSKTFYHLKRISSVEVLLRGVWRIAQNWTNHNLRRCYGIPIWSGKAAMLPKWYFAVFVVWSHPPNIFLRVFYQEKKFVLIQFLDIICYISLCIGNMSPIFPPSLKNNGENSSDMPQ